MKPIKYPYALMAIFIWVGFVCAISFMEAWLKFRAPGINIPLGLGIGRLVFSALNKVEWVLSIIIIASYFFNSDKSFHKNFILFFIALAVLIFQTVYMLPALDVRAELKINGLPTPTSYLHIYYVIMEIIKVSCLVILGFKLIKFQK